MIYISSDNVTRGANLDACIALSTSLVGSLFASSCVHLKIQIIRHQKTGDMRSGLEGINAPLHCEYKIIINDVTGV